MVLVVIFINELKRWMSFDDVNDESLCVALVIAEVPQGTVLSSLMFLIILSLWSLIPISPLPVTLLSLSFSVIHLWCCLTTHWFGYKNHQLVWVKLWDGISLNALSNIGINIQCAAGALQLYAGQTSGMEATIYSMRADKPSGVDAYT